MFVLCVFTKQDIQKVGGTSYLDKDTKWCSYVTTDSNDDQMSIKI